MEVLSLDGLFEKHNCLNPGEIILDVRTAGEYAEGHIPGSINITHEEVGFHVSELQKYKRIYIHCRRGGRAQKAYETLITSGLNNLVCISDAGMDVWCAKGYPTIK